MWGVIALFAKLVGHDVRIREQSVVAPLEQSVQSMVCARILHEVSDGTSQLAGKKRGNDIRAHQVGWQYPRVHPVRWACQVCVKIATSIGHLAGNNHRGTRASRVPDCSPPTGGRGVRSAAVAHTCSDQYS